MEHLQHRLRQEYDSAREEEAVYPEGTAMAYYCGGRVAGLALALELLEAATRLPRLDPGITPEMLGRP